MNTTKEQGTQTEMIIFMGTVHKVPEDMSTGDYMKELRDSM